MKSSDTRVSQPRWRTFGSMALAIATVAVIGFGTIAPAKADYYDNWGYHRGWRDRERHEEWRREEWRERHRPYAYSYSYPSYSYYSYPSYGYYSYPSYGYGYGYGYR
jgi:hypothetical protein